MKIVIITEILSTHSGSRAPIELAEHLSLGNQITLLAFDQNTDKEIKEKLKQQGIVIHLVKPLGFPFGKWLSAFKLLPYLRNQDIISFHGTLPSFLVAKFSGIPIVKTYYGTQLDAYLERFLPNQKLTFKNLLLNWLVNQIILLKEKISFSLANEVVGISKYTTEEAKKLFGRKIPYIYLGSDLPSSQRRSITNNQLPITNYQTTIILSVSRFTPYKGFHQLIKAFKKVSSKIPKAKLILAGQKSNLSYLSYLRNLSNGSSNIQILTDVSDQELASLYQQCDLYATCDRYLFFGLPIIEAASSGKPSIAFDYCAASEIISHGKTGIVVKDIKEFKKALILLVKNNKLRAILGQNAKKKVEKDFDWTTTAQKLERMMLVTINSISV